MSESSDNIIVSLKSSGLLKFTGDADEKKYKTLLMDGKSIDAMNYFLKSRKKERRKVKVIVRHERTRGYRR